MQRVVPGPPPFTQSLHGGNVLFVADLVRLQTQKLTQVAGLPGLQDAPRRSCSAMLSASSLVRLSEKASDGLDRRMKGWHYRRPDALPKKRYLGNTPAEIDPRQKDRVLTCGTTASGNPLMPGESSIRFSFRTFLRRRPMVERTSVGRSRQPTPHAGLLAQDASAMCSYSHADLRKGEEVTEGSSSSSLFGSVLRQDSQPFGFDSQRTTHEGAVVGNRIGCDETIFHPPCATYPQKY